MLTLNAIFYIVLWILVGAGLTYVVRRYVPLDAVINQIIVAIIWLLIIWQILALLGLVSGGVIVRG